MLKTESGRIIGLDRDVAQKEHRNILRSYRIASDRSVDLELAAEKFDIGNKERAEIKQPDKQKITLK